MNLKFEIEPQHESRGEGNGWYPCDPGEAVMWTVYVDDDLHESFETLEEAYQYLSLILNGVSK